MLLTVCPMSSVFIPGRQLSEHDGACRLNPELARHVAQLSLQHYAEVSDTEWLRPV